MTRDADAACQECAVEADPPHCHNCGRTDVLVVLSPHMGVRQCNDCFAAALMKGSR